MKQDRTNGNGADHAVALIAHDAQKEAMLDLLLGARTLLCEESLVATATNGGLIHDRLDLRVHGLESGPLGGDLQIGALVASGEIKLVIFLRDPLSAHPHEPDIEALMNVCDIHQVPLATNVVTARLCLSALTRDGEEFAGLCGRDWL